MTFLGCEQKDWSILILPASLAFARLKLNLLPESAKLSGWENKSMDGIKMQPSLPGSHTLFFNTSELSLSTYTEKEIISVASRQICTHTLGSDITSIIFLRKPSLGLCVQPYRVNAISTDIPSSVKLF